MSRWAARGVLVAIGIALIAAGPSTRALGVVIVVARVFWAMVGTARGQGSTGPREYVRTYDATVTETFEALRAAVKQLRYRVRSIDKANSEIAFNTGMSWSTWAGQDFTAVAQEHQAGKTELRMVGATSRRGLGGLHELDHWAETEKLGNRVLDRTNEELRRRH